MNEQLQKQLADMLASLTSTVKDGAVWVGNQIPPLVQEKIVLGRAEETALMVGAIGFFLVGLYLTKKTYKWVMDNLNEGPTVLLWPFYILPGVMLIELELHDFLMVWFAPRLYIVEWLKGMISK